MAKGKKVTAEGPKTSTQQSAESKKRQSNGTAVREFRATCPQCGKSDTNTVEHTHSKPIGATLRTDRWRHCKCGQHFRSYSLEPLKS
jgi:hypothetical protein